MSSFGYESFYHCLMTHHDGLFLVRIEFPTVFIVCVRPVCVSTDPWVTDLLQQCSVRMISNEECNKSVPGYITDNTFCSAYNWTRPAFVSDTEMET